MKITTIGLDLSKTVFQIHGVDEAGAAVGGIYIITIPDSTESIIDSIKP